jgi:hypothetical protein
MLDPITLSIIVGFAACQRVYAWWQIRAAESGIPQLEARAAAARREIAHLPVKGKSGSDTS